MSEQINKPLQRRHARLWSRLYRLLLLLYSAVLFWEMFLGRYRSHGGVRRYNLIPLRTIARYMELYKSIGYSSVILVNLAGNVAAFMPLGFLLPLVFRRADRLGLIVRISLLTSISAEVCQWIFNVGGMDIDDVLLNTLGGVLGYLCYRLLAVKLLKEHRTRQQL